MAKQQTKRRKKRYEPGSAYAGDVKPTGILGFMGGSTTIKVVFIAMVAALAAGGLVSIFASGLYSGSGSHSQTPFVIQDDEEDEEGTPVADGDDLIRYDAPPPLTIDPSKSYFATITTDLGVIEIALSADIAPETVNNFIFLSRESFYDGIIFHFADGDFSANVGDPACTTSNNSCSGGGGPGYELGEDIAGTFEEGTLGMVNGSQFFIALTDSEQFDGYTPFGSVTSGLDVAKQLVRGSQIQNIEINEG